MTKEDALKLKRGHTVYVKSGTIVRRYTVVKETDADGTVHVVLGPLTEGVPMAVCCKICYRSYEQAAGSAYYMP